MTRTRRKEYSEATRGAIIALKLDGNSYREISQKLRVSSSSAQETVARFKRHKRIKSRPRSGRPPAISTRTRRRIVRTLRDYRDEPYKAIADRIGSVSWRQVQTIAHKEGYRRRVAVRKPYINEPTRKKRLGWAESNQKTNWNSLVWTDEVIIETGERPTHPRVTRKPDEAYLPECVVPTFRSGRQSIALWGCISHGYKGPLILLELSPYVVNANGRKTGGGLTAKGYTEQVLSGPLPQFMAAMRDAKGLDMLVVEDGASAHRAVVARNKRSEEGICQFPHPPSSPDLNPIEAVWRLLKNRVAENPDSRRGREKLWEATQAAWESITVEEINKHTGKMVDRVEAVLEAKGKHTKF